MPPTVCITEFPMMGTIVRRRQNHHRNNTNGAQRRTFASLGQVLRTIVEAPATPRENCLRGSECTNVVPNYSIPDKDRKHPTNTGEQHRRLVAARKDLLSIVIRTIILVRRNRILRRRLNALRAETRRFLRSVLNNPENQHRREIPQTPMYPEDKYVSSSTQENNASMAVSSSCDYRDTISDDITSSTCDNGDHTNDDSSTSDKFEGTRRNEC